jgi:hypothetical protein
VIPVAAAFVCGAAVAGVGLIGLAVREVEAARADARRVREWAASEVSAIQRGWSALAPEVLRRGARDDEIAFGSKLQRLAEWAQPDQGR